jgi:NADH oxidase (H2O2-forming)
MNKVLVIGLGAAGFSAIMSAKKENQQANITVVDPKNIDIVHPCGLPYALEGLADKTKLSQNIYLEKAGIKKINGKLLKINHNNKNAHVLLNDTLEEIVLNYDTMIIAVGAKPLIPNITGIDKFFGKGLHTLVSMNDLESITLCMKRAKTAAIIGAGAIGLESAYALKDKCKVNIFEMREHVLAGVLDADMASMVEEYLKENNINLFTNLAVEEFLGNEKFNGLKAGGENFQFNFGILSTGFAADIFFASDSGLDIENRAIKVNDKLETNLNGIFAAGDCTAVKSVVDKTPSNVKLATSAYKQGNIAGINAAGGNAVYHGTAGTFVTKIGDLEIAGSGYTLESAKLAGYSTAAGKITQLLRPEYMANNSKITVKVIADSLTGKILGGQAIGISGASERVNIISMAIEFGISIFDLKRFEMAYCPAVSEPDDALMKALDFCIRRIKK